MIESDQVIDTLVSAVYVSSANKELSSAELTQLLSETRVRNQRRGITGMLLYRDGNFLQVIEGPENKVDELLSALKKDTRHHGMIVLKKSKISERQFGQWQMAFRDITAANLKDLEGYSSFMGLSFTDLEFQSKPHLCYKLLTQFKDNSR